jgi:hypothetical protein
MSDILFRDAEHQLNFENMLNRIPVYSKGDLCCRSTLYLLSMITRDGGNFFDFDKCRIIPDKAYEELEYLGEYKRIVKLAYMLWCGIYSDNLYDYDISQIFGTDLDIYMIQALKIRFQIFSYGTRERRIHERDKYWEEHQEEKKFFEHELMKMEKESYNLECEIFSFSATIIFLQKKKTIFQIWRSIDMFNMCKEQFQKVCTLTQECNSLNRFEFSRKKQLSKDIATEEKELETILSRGQMKKSHLELSDAEEEVLKTLSVKLSLYDSIKNSIDKIKYELIRER